MKTIYKRTKVFSLRKTKEILERYEIVNLRLAKRNELCQFKINQYETFIKKVDSCIKALKQPYDLVFKNTFVEKNFYWWVDYYSSAHYYRLRTLSAIEFMKAFRNL